MGYDRRPGAPNSAAYLGLVAPPTGVAATDAANIQAAHDALPATGGYLQLQTGVYALGTTGLTLSKPVRFVGMGGVLPGNGDIARVAGVTTLTYSGATGDAITVSSHGVTLRDFVLSNTSGSTPTAGSGVRMTLSSQAQMENVTVAGFYDNVVMTNGQYWAIERCFLFDQVRYGISVDNGVGTIYQDHGAFLIEGCVFTALTTTRAASAAIRWRSGGGGRIIANQVNGGSIPGNASAGRFAVGIDLAVADNVATGDFQIASNDINNTTSACVQIHTENASTPTACSIINTVITGNGFNSSSGAGLVIGAPAATNSSAIKGVAVHGNIFGNLTGSSIVATYCQALHIGVNTHRAVGSPVIKIGTGSYDEAVQGLTLDSQSVYDDSIDLLNDWRAMNSPNRNLDGLVAHRYRRTCRLTSAGTWTTMFTITPWALGSSGSGGHLVFQVNGQNSTTGAVVGKYERLWTVANNSSAPALATVGADATAGAGQWEVQFVTSANLITVQVRIAAGAAIADIQAVAELSIAGQVNKVHKGA